MDGKKASISSKLMRVREAPISEVCGAVGVFRATLYRYPKPDGSLREDAS